MTAEPCRRCGHSKASHQGALAPQCNERGCTCLAFVGAPPKAQATVYAVPLDELHPSSRNPRSTAADVDELAESIREHGILQPLLATKRDEGGLTLVAGHRRLAAARRIGLESVPVIVLGKRLADDQFTISIVENLQRVQLAPMDEARACKALLDHGRGRADIALELSRSGNWVADRLALLELPRELQLRVDAGTLPLGKAARLGKKVRRTGSGSVTLDARAAYHFTKRHELAAVATERCNAAGHPPVGRIGPACGQCWEDIIRADERASLQGETT